MLQNNPKVSNNKDQFALKETRDFNKINFTKGAYKVSGACNRSGANFTKLERGLVSEGNISTCLVYIDGDKENENAMAVRWGFGTVQDKNNHEIVKMLLELSGIGK